MITKFNTRPKSGVPCLWVRMTYKDGFKLEGLISNDLLKFRHSPGMWVLLPAQGSGQGGLMGRGQHHVPFCIPHWMLRDVVVLGTLNTDRAARAAVKETRWKKATA